MVSGDILPESVRNRIEPRVIAEYQLPYIGSVILLDDSANKEQVHGAYWARVNGLGIAGRYSSSQEDLTRKVSEEILLSLIRKRKELTDELMQIDEVFPSDTRSLHNLSSGEWMKKYKKDEGQSQIKSVQTQN